MLTQKELLKKIQPFINKDTWPKIVGVVLLVIVIVLGVSYYRAKTELALLTTGAGRQAAIKKETEELTAKVGKLIRLPTDEEPTIVTVANVEILAKEQPFYKNAHNGDRLLVYTKAQKAIIYDPAQHILVNVGPVYINSPTTSAGSGEGKK